MALEKVVPGTTFLRRQLPVTHLFTQTGGMGNLGLLDGAYRYIGYFGHFVVG
jgi:hypothetical protein